MYFRTSFIRLTGMFLATVILLFAVSCAKKDPELVYRAYEYASVYPDAFDNYAIENLFARADEFASCAESVRASLAERFPEAVGRCEEVAPEYRDACYELDVTKVDIMLEAMIATARQQTLYAESIPGQAAVMGRQILGTGSWESIQRQLAPVFRPVLLCN